MDVHVVGSGPSVAGLDDALREADVTTVEAGPGDLADARFGVVSDLAGSDVFAVANGAALEGNTPWVAIEIGGVGAQQLEGVDAAITGFAPDAGCFRCLRARVESTGPHETSEPRADRAAVRLAGAVAGYELTRLFSGAEGAIVGNVLELPWTRRRLWPVPGCPCGERRERSLGEDDRSMDAEAAAAVAEPAIDERVGLLTSIGEVESFPAPYYLAEVADTTGFSEVIAPPQAAGVDEGWDAAFVKAVGEGLERYCAGVYTEGDLVYGSADELEGSIHPETFVRPDDGPELGRAERAAWVSGEDLHTGEAVHLPASGVHFPPPEPRYLPAITTGLGLGASTVDALVSGLTEVLERDATMIAWYSTFEPVRLEVEDERFDRLARRVAGEDLSVTPLLVTQDVDVPVVTVAVHRDGDGSEPWPRFAVGSAASLDPVRAAHDALCEATQNWMELRSLGPADAAEERGAIGDYADFPESARKLVDVEATVPATDVGPDSIPEGGDRLAVLLEALAEAELAAYATRLTTRDVSTVGFEAVRVLVPDAQPLFTETPCFGDRAESVPAELGYESRLDAPMHPYP